MYTKEQIEQAENYLQKIMNVAYENWRKTDWSQAKFWLHLSYSQKVAVYFGNLNYQVYNGGFFQWHDNRYSKCANELILILEDVNTNSSMAVANIIRQVMSEVKYRTPSNSWFYDDEEDEEYYDLDEYDNEFYDISEILMVEIVEYLKVLEEQK